MDIEPNNVIGESVLWKGHPSQILNFWTFLVLGIVTTSGLYLIDGPVPVHEWVSGVSSIQVKTLWISFFVMIAWLIALMTLLTRYSVTNERLKKSRGLLVRKCDQMELYRIRDFQIKRPLALWLLGYGHITIHSSDRSHPTLTLLAIKRPERVIDVIRNQAEQVKKDRGVREFDIGQ